MVGHKVDGDGKAFTGGKSITGPIAQGLHYEVTLLQLYKVALSAGKAHRDHKHHHVHHFDFNGPIESPMTTAAPPVRLHCSSISFIFSNAFKCFHVSF